MGGEETFQSNHEQIKPSPLYLPVTEIKECWVCKALNSVGERRLVRENMICPREHFKGKRKNRTE